MSVIQITFPRTTLSLILKSRFNTSVGAASTVARCQVKSAWPEVPIFTESPKFYDTRSRLIRCVGVVSGVPKADDIIIELWILEFAFAFEEVGWVSIVFDLCPFLWRTQGYRGRVHHAEDVRMTTRNRHERGAGRRGGGNSLLTVWDQVNYTIQVVLWIVTRNPGNHRNSRKTPRPNLNALNNFRTPRKP